MEWYIVVMWMVVTGIWGWILGSTWYMAKKTAAMTTEMFVVMLEMQKVIYDIRYGPGVLEREDD